MTTRNVKFAVVANSDDTVTVLFPDETSQCMTRGAAAMPSVLETLLEKARFLGYQEGADFAIEKMKEDIK